MNQNALMITVALLWGVWGFFGKMALNRGMNPISLFIVEILTSSGVVATAVVFLHIYGSTLAELTRYNIFGVLSGIALAIGLLLYYFVLDSKILSIVVPATAAYPAAAVVLGYLFLGERLTAIQWAGIAFVGLGLILVMFEKDT